MLLVGACGAAPRTDSAGTMGTNGQVEHILLRNVYLVASGGGGYERGADGVVRLWLFNTATVEDTLVGGAVGACRVGADRLGPGL